MKKYTISQEAIENLKKDICEVQFDAYDCFGKRYARSLCDIRRDIIEIIDTYFRENADEEN